MTLTLPLWQVPMQQKNDVLPDPDDDLQPPLFGIQNHEIILVDRNGKVKLLAAHHIPA